MSLKHKLMRLKKVSKPSYHPLIKHVHKRHNISKKTLFYVKEYCTKSNVSSVIIRESLAVLIFASIVSSFGGFGLEKWKDQFILLLPISNIISVSRIPALWAGLLGIIALPNPWVSRVSATTKAPESVGKLYFSFMSLSIET